MADPPPETRQELCRLVLSVGGKRLADPPMQRYGSAKKAGGGGATKGTQVGPYATAPMRRPDTWEAIGKRVRNGGPLAAPGATSLARDKERDAGEYVAATTEAAHVKGASLKGEAPPWRGRSAILKGEATHVSQYKWEQQIPLGIVSIGRGKGKGRGKPPPNSRRRALFRAPGGRPWSRRPSAGF